MILCRALTEFKQLKNRQRSQCQIFASEKYVFLKNPNDEITADATVYYAGLHCPLVLGLVSVTTCCFSLDSAVLWAFDIFCFFASAASAQVV